MVIEEVGGEWRFVHQLTGLVMFVTRYRWRLWKYGPESTDSQTHILKCAKILELYNLLIEDLNLLTLSEERKNIIFTGYLKILELNHNFNNLFLIC